jgi:hypothetical protein
VISRELAGSWDVHDGVFGVERKKRREISGEQRFIDAAHQGCVRVFHLAALSFQASSTRPYE